MAVQHLKLEAEGRERDLDATLLAEPRLTGPAEGAVDRTLRGRDARVLDEVDPSRARGWTGAEVPVPRPPRRAADLRLAEGS